MLSNNTAILIFAQTGKQEGVSKPFLKSAVLFNELNKKTVAKVEKTGIPYFHISEENQKGLTFGERYTNAIEQVYAKGFDNVITVGNDTPHLQSSEILEAAKSLENNAMVLGPSCDGGYYLLGINKSHFKASQFLTLPWQTSQLSKCISRLIETKNIEVVLLKHLEDLDSLVDAKRFNDGFLKISEAINKVLLSIFTSETLIIETMAIHFSSFQKNNYFNKGSPTIISL